MRMSDDQSKFLSLRRLPARLTRQQTAWELSFPEHDIPILVMVRLLRPLGNPPENGVKYFAAVEIVKLAQDPQWLAKATNAIYEYWKKKNQRKNSRNPKHRPGLNNHQSEDRTPPNGEE